MFEVDGIKACHIESADVSRLYSQGIFFEGQLETCKIDEL